MMAEAAKNLGNSTDTGAALEMEGSATVSYLREVALPETCLADQEEVEPMQATMAEVRLLRTPARLPVTVGQGVRFVPRAKWEGVALDVRDEEFDARLVDMLGDEDDLTVTFSFDDVSTADEVLLKPGAVFYWNVGYFENAFGQRERSATLKFRRLPVRRKRDGATAKSKARDIRRELGLG